MLHRHCSSVEIKFPSDNKKKVKKPDFSLSHTLSLSRRLNGQCMCLCVGEWKKCTIEILCAAVWNSRCHSTHIQFNPFSYAELCYVHSDVRAYCLVDLEITMFSKLNHWKSYKIWGFRSISLIFVCVLACPTSAIIVYSRSRQIAIVTK